MLDDLSPKMLHAMAILGNRPGAIISMEILRGEPGPRFRATLKALNRRGLVKLDHKAIRGALGYSGRRFTSAGAAEFQRWQQRHEVRA